MNGYGKLRRCTERNAKIVEFKPVGIHASDGATARLYRDGCCSLITVATAALAISHGAAGLATAGAGTAAPARPRGRGRRQWRTRCSVRCGR